ncbi:hypothetical protein MHBO_000063 [Bonamia ostreae]|uniref:Uncharacterized protein n=1 Tax=Bonamia ostreae TaxID=126728 RepID=A0ABV2AE71_9EUKA
MASNHIKITKPVSDYKDYILVRKDKIPIVLVHDPKAQLNAMAISIGVGSISCKKINGLAHFIEHLIFQGGKKNQSFQKTTSELGGLTNAFTAGLQTVFMASFRSEETERAIREFTEMLLDPKFEIEESEKEIKAVNNESVMDKDKDGWRTMLVLKDIIRNKTDHPYSIFGCGNSETLKDVKREDIVDFWEKHYAKHPIRITLYTKQPFDEVIPFLKPFLHLQTEDERIEISENPFEVLQGLRINVSSLCETNTLCFNFPMKPVYFKPTAGDMYPLQLLIQNPADLEAALVDKQLASQVVAGLDENTPFGCVFSIEVQLTERMTTEEGVASVTALLFSFLENLKNMYSGDEGKERTERHLEYAAYLKQFHFDQRDSHSAFDEVTEIVLNTDRNLPDLRNVLQNSSKIVIEDARESFLEGLAALNPQNVFMVFSRKNHPEDKVPNEEKWFGARYGVVKMNIPTTEKFNVGATELIHKYVEPTLFEAPDYEKREKGVSVFIKNRTSFKKLLIYMRTNLVLNKISFPDGMDLKDLFVFHIVADLLNKSILREMSHYSRIGSGFSIGVSIEGFSLTMSTYPEHFSEMLDSAVNYLNQFIQMDFDADLQKYIRHWFEHAKKDLVSGIANEKIVQPYQQCQYLLDQLMLDNEKTIEQKLQIAENLSLNDLERINKIFGNKENSKFGVRMLLLGNTFPDLQHYVEKAFQEYFENSIPDEQLYERKINSYESDVYLRQKATAPGTKNSGVIVARSLGSADDLREILVELLKDRESDPFFADLRTKQSLGYIASITSFKRGSFNLSK